MDWESSSQSARWILAEDELRRARAQVLAPTPGAPGGQVLTEAELALLLKYYGTNLQRVCRELRCPRKVRGTALTYLQRAYLRLSPVASDPAQLLLACLYLACKAEEHYISAAEIARLSGAGIEAILKGELTLLQALGFDLVVHAPYRAIDGLFNDLESDRTQRDPRLDPALRLGSSSGAGGAEGPGGEEGASTAGLDAAPGEDPVRAALQRARERAVAAADTLMLTDAPLRFPPGQVALAAARSALTRAGLETRGWLEIVVDRGREARGGAGEPSAPVAEDGRGPGRSLEYERLWAALRAVDALGELGSKAVDPSHAAAVDRKLKEARAKARAAAKGKDGEEVAERKAAEKKAAAKAAARAAAKATAEASVGVADLNP